MIQLIIIDEHGNAIEQRVIKSTRNPRPARALFNKTVSEQIYIRPDWPPIGSPDFAVRLREWHAQHNQNDARPAGN